MHRVISTLFPIELVVIILPMLGSSKGRKLQNTNEYTCLEKCTEVGCLATTLTQKNVQVRFGQRQHIPLQITAREIMPARPISQIFMEELVSLRDANLEVWHGKMKPWVTEFQLGSEDLHSHSMQYMVIVLKSMVVQLPSLKRQ